jgi:AAA15 family ATPase/GTPase
MMGHSLEGRVNLAKYRMIDRLLISNFRCFESLDLTGFSRINVVVGQNSAGKTALLEALFFAAGGNPDLLLRMRAFRGIVEGVLQVSRDRAGYESLWREMFYGLNANSIVSAKIVGSVGQTREIKMSYAKTEAVASFNLNTSEASGIAPLVFEGIDSSGKKFLYHAEMTDKGISFDSSVGNVAASFFSGMRPPHRETSERFSILSRRQQVTKLITTVNERFPFIEDLSLEIVGGQTMIYAKVKELSEKIPIGLVSGGIEKFLNVLLGIASNPKGIVLIDEIDGCVHHSKISGVWEALRDFAETYETQVFITTHSSDWLTSLNRILAKGEQQFSLLRVETNNDRKHIVRVFPGDTLADALQQDMEIR